MKRFNLVLICLILFSTALYPQPAPAYHPFVANGAKVLHYTNGVMLKWKNPINALSNEIYISYDSSKVAQLDASVKFIKSNPLVDSIKFITGSNFARYFWRVVEFNSNGTNSGTIWSFRTKGSIYAFHDDFDDFEYGTGRWIISGTAYSKWKIDSEPNYQLPVPAYNKILAVKNTQQGVINVSYAEIIVSTPQRSFASLNIYFSSDLKLSGTDSVNINFSTNNGSTWINSYRAFTSERNQNKDLLLLSGSITLSTPIKVRFISFFKDTSSFWAIDKIGAGYWDGYLSEFVPHVIAAEGTENHLAALTVFLEPMITPFIYIYRKSGVPSDPGSFYLLSVVGSWNGIKTIYDSTSTDSVYSYTLSHGALAVSSDEITVYLNGVTPVELTSFTASQNNEKILLNWITASEINNAGFELLKSTNKETWKRIAYVDGIGTSTNESKYSFTDIPDVNGMVYYKLKQIDYDGTFTYSNIIEINFVTNQQYALFQNYPNPFNPATTIQFNIPREEKVVIKLYNILGVEIKTLLNEIRSSGNNTIDFKASDLPSGNYFYKIEAGSFMQTKKLTILK